MKILLIEPFFKGSHKQWANRLKHHSSHQIDILSIDNAGWKWSMQAGCIALAEKFKKYSYEPDCILATDMLDLPTFIHFCYPNGNPPPTIIYFHENQLAYPWTPNDGKQTDKLRMPYAMINLKSALAADKVFFNSEFNRSSFLEQGKRFFKKYKGISVEDSLDSIQKRSHILPLGLDLEKFKSHKTYKKDGPPIILWNHRWEYDKGPGTFFHILKKIKEKGAEFRLVILGESPNPRHIPEIFQNAQKEFKDELLHFGYAENFKDYAEWLWKSDIIPVTSDQDFFGASAIEAIYCNTHPLLPNRMAFPQHVPDRLKADYLYNNDEELQKKVLTLLSNPKKIDANPISEFVKKYDWKELIKDYDEEAFGC